MTARDELLAALDAERYAPRPRPFDTIARVERVGRVDWARAFAVAADPRTGADAEPDPPPGPAPESERNRLRRLMPGRTPKEPPA